MTNQIDEQPMFLGEREAQETRAHLEEKAPEMVAIFDQYVLLLKACDAINSDTFAGWKCQEWRIG